MTITIKIIGFNSDDYNSALELRQRILRSPLALKLNWADTANDVNEYHLGAFESKTLIGCLILRPLVQSRVRLRQMAIEPTYQRKGIGSKLLRYAEQLALNKGFTVIEIHARSEIRAFYEKFGYQSEGKEFTEITLSHIMMTKQLSPECK